MADGFLQGVGDAGRFVGGFLGVAKDNADRRRAEEALLREKQKEQTLKEFQGGLLPQYEQDQDGNKILKGYEYTPEEKQRRDLERTKGQLDVELKQEQLRQKKKELEALEARPIQDTVVTKLSEGRAVFDMLPDIEKTIKINKDIFGPVEGRVKGFNPFNPRAMTIEAQLRVAAQAFGKFMEGGKLTREDEVKYEKMFPGIRDTAEVAENKLKIIQRLLAQRYNMLRSGYERSKFDVSGFDSLNVPDVPGLIAEEDPETTVNDSGSFINTLGRALGFGKKAPSKYSPPPAPDYESLSTEELKRLNDERQKKKRLL